MAAAVNFSGQAAWPPTCSKAKAVARLSHGTLPYKETCYLKNQSRRIQKRGLYVKRKAESTLFNDRAPVIVMSSNSNSSLVKSSPPPSEIVKKFYTCINNKNLMQLHEFIAEDCYFEECSFPQPFHGRKEVMQFLEQLTESMGQNVKFNIGLVCEGDESTAGVKWHLEWKNSQIPFTRGSSFFECSKQEERIIIKKAQIVIESPVKPGGLVLTLFKTLTSLFDEFPKATEWFLNSPHVMLHWILSIYLKLVARFINPLLSSYINIKLWSFTAKFFIIAFNILRYIFRIFFK